MRSYGHAVQKENEVPLLADKTLYPNCPGCKCAYLSAKGAGPPVKELFMVSSVVLCNGEHHLESRYDRWSSHRRFSCQACHKFSWDFQREFNICLAMVITGSFLLVNNAVDTDQRGAANGISLSCVAVFRAIAPAMGGALFAWGESRHNATFLPGSQLVFVVLDLICVAAIFTMYPPLPKHLDKPYSELNFQETYHDKDKKNMPILQ